MHGGMSVNCYIVMISLMLASNCTYKLVSYQGYFKLTTILICCSLFFIHCAVAPKWCHYSLQVAPKRNFHPHTAFFGRPHGLVKPKPNTKGYKIYSWVPLQSCTSSIFYTDYSPILCLLQCITPQWQQSPCQSRTSLEYHMTFIKFP